MIGLALALAIFGNPRAEGEWDFVTDDILVALATVFAAAALLRMAAIGVVEAMREGTARALEPRNVLLARVSAIAFGATSAGVIVVAFTRESTAGANAPIAVHLLAWTLGGALPGAALVVLSRAARPATQSRGRRSAAYAVGAASGAAFLLAASAFQPTHALKSAEAIARGDPYCVLVYDRKAPERYRPAATLFDMSALTMRVANSLRYHAMLLVQRDAGVEQHNWSYWAGGFDPNQPRYLAPAACQPRFDFGSRLPLA
jgi:hypothetical protein